MNVPPQAREGRAYGTPLRRHDRRFGGVYGEIEALPQSLHLYIRTLFFFSTSVAFSCTS